jgi:hypothetical protein
MNREELLAKKQSGVVLSEEEEAFLASSDSTSESTPPTPSPTPSPTDGGTKERYIGILEQTLREQNRQIQELMNNRGGQPPAAPPAPPDPERQKQDFYNNPVETTRTIVQDALKEAIAPLNEFVRGLRIDGSPFANMLAKFKADPRFSEVLKDPQVVQAVEKILSNAELSEINMQSAIVHATGLKSMGLLVTLGINDAPPAPAPAPVPAPAPSPAPSSTVLPPHVRPSAPAAPTPRVGGDKPARPALTENQRRIMREQGFKTEAEYWDWMELPASEVAHTDLGTKPAGGR